MVFTFHHKDPDAWGAVLEAIDGAGLRVVNTYPVRGENRLSVHINGQRAIQLDSVIVCRNGRKHPTADWAEVAERIEAAARERLARFRGSDSDDLSMLDASVVVRGACMTQFSAYERVLDGDDEVDERDAMNRVQRITTALNEGERPRSEE
jgi:adenine-specific DNA methylase